MKSVAKKMKCGAFNLCDGFEFSSNGFMFKTFIDQIHMSVQGIHNGTIEFATVYKLGVTIECLGRDPHAKRKALDSLASDELADKNMPILADTFKQGNTFTFEKDGHKFYASVEAIEYEAQLKFLYDDWDHPGQGYLRDTRIASIRWKATIEVIEVDPQEVVVLSKYVGDRR